MSEMLWDGQKEKWKEALQEIDRKKTELLPEHQKMHWRSQKLQSLQDKKRNYLKDACACEEEMQKLSEEMEERQARVQALSEKLGNCRMAADGLEEDTKDLQAGEERRGSCALQVFTLGVALAEQYIQALQESWIRRLKVSATLVHTTGRKEKRRIMGRGANAKSGQSTNGSTSVSWA